MFRFPIFIIFIGCRTNMENKPIEGELLDEDSTVSVDTGTDSTEADSETDTVNDTDAESDDEPNDPIDTSLDDSVFRLTSGIWDLSNATIVSDICGWNYHLTNAFGLELADFLPSSFNVEAEAGQFRIKAISYGARDNITCTIEGRDFSCTLQTVDAQQVLSYEDGGGWPRSWVYEISFNGRIIDEDNLSGVASVEYPQINPGDAYALATAGLNPADCGQSFELTMVKR